ncbi:HAD-IA family hydrolase [Microbacterium dextranolyticum]|uniref:Beta-lactamase-related domain-containing protein n=1 Tax=Microbacterium dextranolyticum TaxID=36806 RepID=A0A9W6HK47_9MICO|nr:HAD-IA family hydrolase [Microbacterium dextranolyticum]MBM7461732.1 HAD superfamily hydrolase (TIGR01509 family) [Microbacterium dextranolyticum]GLJ93973.1 hypothetical protein GCM10017591_00340 [Microbacterium dextranolyticum]
MTPSPQSPRPRPRSPLMRRDPAALGIPQAALLALADRLAEESLDPHALLIARGGDVAFETAWAPYALDRPALVYSASKTYTALAIGYLADERRLRLDDSAGMLLGLPDPHGITVRHLLTMNTGHTGAQIEAIGMDPARLLATGPSHAPGTFFAYNSPASHALSAIVTAVTGERMTDYLRPRLLDPLGIGERWMDSVDGIQTGASGFHLTVDDLTRTATMLGAGGVFRGTQVASDWFIEEMTRPWSNTAAFDGPVAAAGEVNDWALGYGYQVWRSRHGFRLDGAAGQFALVVPELDLTIAYQGATLDTQATLRAFWAFVDAVGVASVAGEAADASEGIYASELPAAGDPAPDTWSSRERLTIMTEASFEADGLMLSDAGDGWTLALPGVGTLPVSDAWTAARLSRGDALSAPSSRPEAVADPAADDLRLAARGEQRSDGSVLVHVVDTTSPHRVIVIREADGSLRAGWHIPPIGGGWEVLRVPSVVTRRLARSSALLLDMDGTLVDSHAVVERLWTQWSIDHGIDPAYTLSIIHGRQGQESMALLLPDRPPEVTIAENRELLAAETAQTEGVVAIAGAGALLEGLKTLPHALVTSATRALADARMEAAGIRMPAVAVTAEDVVRSKPDPEGFLAAARRLGVEPADAIVVEDSANGIAAGLAAGMRVIGIGPHAAAAGPTWTVPDATAIHVQDDGDGGIRLTLD